MPATPSEEDEPFTWKKAFFNVFTSLIMAGLGLTAVIIPVGAVCHHIDTRLNWVETPCRVEQVGIDDYSRRSDKVTIVYHYTVNGQPYTGKRYCWWEGNLTHSEATARAEAIRRAPAPTCYVDPDDPQEAVFDVRIDWACVLIAMPVGSIFAALGLFVLGATLWEAGMRGWKAVRGEAP